MRIFVTGGSGLLGNTILRRLNETSHSAAYMVRSETDSHVFEGIDAKAFQGDLNDRESIENAAKWADVVIHSAGLIHLGWKRLDESMRVNAEGTRNVVDACLKHDCRLLYVGTVNTLAVASRETVADESTPLEHAGGQIECSYVVSKRAGVAEVQRGIESGLQAVLLHPGFMLGPWDWKPSSGRMMLEVGRGWKPISPRGGCSVCDVRDVADGIIAAIDTQVANGRSFVLAGHNETYYRLWTEMAKRFGQLRPIMPAGPLQRLVAAKGGDLLSKLTRHEPDINSAAVAMSSQYHWYSSARAQTELGYQIRPMHETLDDAADWIRNRFF
ncbi:NAD-dependent epimerase/dehydratase family protein [Aporhodopirellula aestuarii]|uniref:NAD-dependent epimerase/dehydratase family protein n=1 Tax=Aporhodopirellula aestuarii TaxID=2950107 RepID=A0ABT0U6S3_9BACT|nr:NAD-dependent epimerase/dehydratase family protein [Aporhodopirellula aestuarii]MCM2372486.1 NAD-dependent epimerase/dehydratase family protein [Aporhodopirellula aestuarii]